MSIIVGVSFRALGGAWIFDWARELNCPQRIFDIALDRREISTYAEMLEDKYVNILDLGCEVVLQVYRNNGANDLIQIYRLGSSHNVNNGNRSVLTRRLHNRD